MVPMSHLAWCTPGVTLPPLSPRGTGQVTSKPRPEVTDPSCIYSQPRTPEAQPAQQPTMIKFAVLALCAASVAASGYGGAQSHQQVQQ